MTGRCARRASAAARGAALLLLAGIPSAPPRGSAPAATRPPALILITLDTFRRDRLSAFGGRGGAPALDRFFAGAERFDQAVTPAPLTLPAHASLLTGRLPPDHGARDNGRPLRAGVETWAAALSAAGYRTVALVASRELSASTGIGQGFGEFRELYDPEREEAEAATVSAAALDVLDRAATDPRPLFLWVHYYDAHWPYAAPGARVGDYDAEIAYLDGKVAPLLAVLARPPWSSATVVIAGDHGESLGEHGEMTHGYTLYESAVRVPLAIRSAGRRPGVNHAAVTLAEVPDLVRRRSATPAPHGARATGEDPGAVQVLETQHPRLTFGYAPWRAARTRGAKYIAEPGGEWYDLSADPRETRDLASARPPPAPLRAALPASDTAPESPVPDNLRGLGYVNPGVKPGGGDGRKAERARLRLAESVVCDTLLGRYHALRGEAAPAISALDRALADIPGFAQALYWRGRVRLGQGDFPAAERDLGAAAAADPGLWIARYHRALALLRVPGRSVDAEGEFRRVLERAPSAGPPRLGLAIALEAQGRRTEALAECETLLRGEPGNAPARQCVARLQPAGGGR